ncbi:speriolin-like [Protopterus annectens]|uniref:speriolin-like n=1 Tax=Protopterus annectens TaxID=7888 RepID=UPI001CFA2190|nr:speriolin-like [Protopterus annectens]
MTFILGRKPQKNECSVSDILNVIEQATTNPMTRHVNEFLRAVMSNRYTTIMTVLNRLGYNAYVHPHNTEELIQRCGLLNHRPQRGTPEYYALNNYDYLHTIIMKDVPETIRETCLILLNCLHYLAREEGQPMFMW